MSELRPGSLVVHVSDLALGEGQVKYVETVAGVTQALVAWGSSTGHQMHTSAELIVKETLAERLRLKAGPASRIPFQLKVLGRWFEARHSLTGELSNQPFQMLPHQIIVANRVVNSARAERAFLIADDVGLGKTIEAGMIMEVLRKRTLGAFRCLIVTPAGLLPQWQEEMAMRFRRKFRTLQTPADLGDVDQLIVSIDTVRNQAKFGDAIAQARPWELVIFDEAHHLASGTDVQRHKVAQLVRPKARNILFLSATPHSGNNVHFYNMLRILREDLFPKGAKDYPGVPLKQVMIRNRKSDVTDVNRERIFKGIAPARIIPFAPTADEVAFSEELREYLRTGYREAERLQRKRDGKSAMAVGFLMSTFGKLASSSRAAIASALENRLRALDGEVEGEASLNGGDDRFAGEKAAREVTFAALEAPSGRGRKKKESLIEGERARVASLLRKLEATRAKDTKMTSFLERIGELPGDVKVLIFTEYRATQSRLVEALESRFGPNSVAQINGSMDTTERKRQVESFNEDIPNPRFMVSTEAGGEGLNMQKSCHTVVNYDLPWNPMVLQQRIGRVYRYGQRHPVVVFNLRVDSTSDAFADQRVYEYLERKIDEVTAKLREVQGGESEDIRGEVLGQVAEQFKFDELYKTAIEEGRARAEREIDTKALQIEEILADREGMLGLFRGLERFDITAYEKVAARVSPAHLEFFVKHYLAKQGVDLRVSGDGLMSFPVPRALQDVAENLAQNDPFQVRETIGNAPVERATVDKALAQRTLHCRLLRFGDAVFDAMVQHVQHGGFSDGVASLELPADVLGWEPGTEGAWVLFDLRILRSGPPPTILRNELASFVVPQGGEVRRVDELVEHLHDAFEGPRRTDEGEAERAYRIGYVAAEARLAALKEEVVREFGSADSVQVKVQDVAMAWVRAS